MEKNILGDFALSRRGTLKIGDKVKGKR